MYQETTDSDVFWAGFDAAKRYMPRSSNPFKEGEAQYRNWDYGWISGDDDIQLNEEDDLRPW